MKKLKEGSIQVYEKFYESTISKVPEYKKLKKWILWWLIVLKIIKIFFTKLIIFFLYIF